METSVNINTPMEVDLYWKNYFILFYYIKQWDSPLPGPALCPPSWLPGLIMHPHRVRGACMVSAEFRRRRVRVRRNLILLPLDRPCVDPNGT